MITLNEICGYLPHRLKIAITTDRGVIYKEVTGIQDDRYPVECEIPFMVRTGLDVRHYVFYHKNYKPVFHPLSDLTKEIEVNGEKFVPMSKLFGESYDEWDGESTSICQDTYKASKGKVLCKFLPNWVIEHLYEWHFDIHDLIERGDAIDINTIE